MTEKIIHPLLPAFTRYPPCIAAFLLCGFFALFLTIHPHYPTDLYGRDVVATFTVPYRMYKKRIKAELAGVFI